MCTRVCYELLSRVPTDLAGGVDAAEGGLQVLAGRQNTAEHQVAGVQVGPIPPRGTLQGLTEGLNAMAALTPALELRVVAIRTNAPMQYHSARALRC